MSEDKTLLIKLFSMEFKRGELKADAEIIARHAKNAIEGGAVIGRVYAFDDLGEHHAQSLRTALKQDPVTRGRVKVRRMDQQGYPGHRGAFIKK